MPELTASVELQAPAAAIWHLLEDFGAIQRWWPREVAAPIERVVIEGDGVGMVRHIQNRGMPHPVSERLDFIDPTSRTWMLSIVGTRPMGITAYVAEGHLVDLDGGRSRIDYRALFTTAPGAEEQVRKGLLKTWAIMFRGLEATARRD